MCWGLLVFDCLARKKGQLCLEMLWAPLDGQGERAQRSLLDTVVFYGNVAAGEMLAWALVE